MELRETIAFNNDLITGQEILVKKLKPKHAPMVNTATVQLFDAETGEKIYEAKAENIVNNAVAKLAFMEFFFNRIKNDGSVNTINFDLFNHILITNYTGAEDPNIKVARGAMIGYADKTYPYAGASTVQGTINKAETTFVDGLFHFVFDFATNACNGTFQTIWWTNDQGGKFVCGPTWFSTSAWNDIRVCLADRLVAGSYNLYANPASNTASFTYDKAGSAYNSTTPVKSLIAPTGMSANINSSGAEFDGTNVWLIEYTAKKLHKFNSDFSALISTVAITGWNTTTMGADIGDLIELNGTLYVFTQNCCAVPINKTTGAMGTPIDLKPTLGKVSTFTGQIGATTNGTDAIFILIDSTSTLYILDVNFALSGQIIKQVDWNYMMGRMAYDRTKDVLYMAAVASSTFRGFYLDLTYTAPGAQNLLAAPVTKNATNTMKIQYDFQIQKIV